MIKFILFILSRIFGKRQIKFPAMPTDKNLMEIFSKGFFNKNCLKEIPAGQFAWKSCVSHPKFIYSSLPDGTFMEYELEDTIPKNKSFKQVFSLIKTDSEQWVFGSKEDIKKLYA